MLYGVKIRISGYRLSTLLKEKYDEVSAQDKVEDEILLERGKKKGFDIHAYPDRMFSLHRDHYFRRAYSLKFILDNIALDEDYILSAA